MKSKTIFGALLLSVALCSQGFGLELLDRMLGLKNCGGCGECNACAKAACCEPVKACCPEPCCPVKACEPACEPSLRTSLRKEICRATPVRDLFAGIKDLFECDRCGRAGGCGCEPAKACCPVKACAPEPCCPVKACEPACEASLRKTGLAAKKHCKRLLQSKRLRKRLRACEKAACEPGLRSQVRKSTQALSPPGARVAR